jgi:hypothetical protein
MAYDEKLAGRIREILPAQHDLVEKKMFGGVAYMLHGNMSCGVHGNRLIVRLGAERHAAAMAEAHTLPFDFSGRPMAGWVMVEPEGCASEEDLVRWVQKGVDYALSLPLK